MKHTCTCDLQNRLVCLFDLCRPIYMYNTDLCYNVMTIAFVSALKSLPDHTFYAALVRQ